jgi:hypothetical protein
MNKYPCNNCTSQGKLGCTRGLDGCQLTICMAEHIAEPGKIEKFMDVLSALHMTIRVSGDSFRIVSV